jgi:cytochrome oxidase Cu insertion factor (SCO1/SenC/PrrC family)
MSKEYEINEKDIDSVIRYLKIYDPEHATPEMAIEILENFNAGIHLMSHTNPELLEKLYKELNENKNNT